MSQTDPFRRALATVPVAALSLLLLTAGMCRQADDGAAAQAAEEQAALQEAEALRAALEQERLEAERAAAEQQRQLEERQRELREEEARLAAERQRQLEAERQRLAAERAAAAERERQLAERERQLREQQQEVERRQQELAEQETIVVEQSPPEPLPEPTGTYEGNFDEPWRESREPGAAAAGDSPQPADPPARRTASLQAGEQLEVQIVTTLTSETARVGDRFSTRLVEDLRDASGRLVVPAGAEVVGRVTEVAPYRRGGGAASLAVEFNEIVVPPDQRVGIRASFVELGADKRKNRRKVVAGAVVGAILGHILGGDGSKNVIIGAAAGAAAGGAVVASARDRDAEIPAGEILTLQLEEVVTVQVEYGAATGGR